MYIKTFTGMTADQVSELIDTFGEACHDWDKAAGTASVDFDEEEEAAAFEEIHRFAE